MSLARSQSPVRGPRRARQIKVGREQLLLSVLVLVFAITGVRSHDFVSWTSISGTLTDSSSVALVVVGEAIVIIGGGIDISVGSTLGAAATAAGLLVEHGANPWLAMAAAVGVGLALGIVNALLIIRLKIPPIVATLGTLGIFAGVLSQTTQNSLIDNLPNSFLHLAQGKLLGLNYPVWVVIVVMLIGGAAMRFTSHGRIIYAIGNNIEAVRRAGINIDRYRAATYLITGGLAGLAGGLYAAQYGTVFPSSGQDLDLAVIAAAVVGGIDIFGGRGSIVGAILAAVLIQTITGALITVGVGPAWQQAVTGGTILVAVSIFALTEHNRRKRTGVSDA
jgi:ribose/xylose/arabinose/galactoside ABC-type transport system permease subunit